MLEAIEMLLQGRTPPTAILLSVKEVLIRAGDVYTVQANNLEQHMTAVAVDVSSRRG